MFEEYKETDYPVISAEVYHTWSEEVPGDYYYTWGYQVNRDEDIKLEIDLNEDPYLEYYENGLSEDEIIAEVLYTYYFYSDDDKWTVQHDGSIYELAA